MITIKLEESEIFKIMVGSMEDRTNLLISESVMQTIDVSTIKSIVETEIERAKENGQFDDDKLTDVIKLLQMVAYNCNISKDSEQITTYIFDKLFEIICHDFW